MARAAMFPILTGGKVCYLMRQLTMEGGLYVAPEASDTVDTLRLGQGPNVTHDGSTRDQRLGTNTDQGKA